MTTANDRAKVKYIIADQLGVGEDEIKPEPRLHRGPRRGLASTSSSW